MASLRQPQRANGDVVIEMQNLSNPPHPTYSRHRGQPPACRGIGRGQQNQTSYVSSNTVERDNAKEPKSRRRCCWFWTIFVLLLIIGACIGGPLGAKAKHKHDHNSLASTNSSQVTSTMTTSTSIVTITPTASSDSPTTTTLVVYYPYYYYYYYYPQQSRGWLSDLWHSIFG